MPYPRRGKLTDEQVVKIRVAYARGYKSSYQLAREYQMTSGNIQAIAQGSFYRTAGGPLTWPDYCSQHQRPLPPGKVRGRCWDVACTNPIASSGWAQRMHLCERCFRINGGKKCGRGKLGKSCATACRWCQKRFSYYRKPSMKRRQYCSAHCGRLYANECRRVRPADLTSDRLYDLYWGEGLTTYEIAARLGNVGHDTVLWWMTKDGIPRRARSRRRLSCCAVERCGKPIHEQISGAPTSYGYLYGTLCYEHHLERARRTWRRLQDRAIEERGAALTEQIASLLSGLPESVKTDAQQEIVLAVLAGDVPPLLTPEIVKPFIARAFRENADAYKFLSLAAPVNTDEGAQTWGDRLGLS